jgi:hypothetical protein
MSSKWKTIITRIMSSVTHFFFCSVTLYVYVIMLQDRGARSKIIRNPHDGLSRNIIVVRCPCRGACIRSKDRCPRAAVATTTVNLPPVAHHSRNKKKKLKYNLRPIPKSRMSRPPSL